MKTKSATAWVLAMAVAAVISGVAGSGPAFGRQTGLNALPEEKVVGEINRLGLKSLSEREKATGNVSAPAAATGNLADLFKQLSAAPPGDRDAIIRKLLPVLDAELASAKGQTDPATLLSWGEVLITAGVFKDLNTIEYWGDSPVVMARLKPVAMAASRLLDKATSMARKSADDVANKLTGANDPNSKRYEELEALAVKSEYTRRMNDYAVVRATDAADPSRLKLAGEVIEYLKQYDNPDSEVQAGVRIMTGKLQLAGGNPTSAIQTLDGVWSPQTKVVPAPTPAQQYEARYFAAVAAASETDVTGAKKRLGDLVTWQSTALTGDALAGAQAAAKMLDYRLAVAAKDDAGARKVLLELVKQRPEFEGTVLDQLATRLPDTQDLKTLDPLMLRAVFRRGEIEARKPDNQVPDPKLLEDGFAAGKELLAKPGTDLTLVEETSIRLPILLERMGKNIEAADMLLDFIRKYGGVNKNSVAALDEATYLVAKLRRESPEDPAVGKVYERLLGVAVSPPFSKTEYSYEYARRLQQTGKYAEAVTAFEQVPASDSRAALARFFRMVAIKQMLDDGKVPTATRGARLDEVLSLAQQVSAEAKDRLAKGGGDTKNDKLILVRTALVGSDVALREKHNPDAAMKLLDGFEDAAKGLTGEKDLVSQANQVRILAKMDQGKNEEAARDLVKLLDQSGGSEGAEIVYKLLSKLNDDFDKAKTAGNTALMASLAKIRANLSGRLVEWASTHQDAKIRQFAYRYRLFDADTKRVAANLEPDATARQKALEDAMAAYDRILAEQGPNPDPVAELGVALVSYDLGKLERARDLLAKLLSDRKLGKPELEEDRNGEMTLVPNDRYWEATLKLMRATVNLADSEKVPATAKAETADGLKALYARWGNKLGGPRWGPEFEALRKSIAPDYVVPEL